MAVWELDGPAEEAAGEVTEAGVVGSGLWSGASRSITSGGGGGTEGAGGWTVGGGGGIGSDVVDWSESLEAAETWEFSLEVGEGGTGAGVRRVLRGVVVVRAMVML